MPRFTTLKQIDEAGFDLRLHCFACDRTHQLDPIIWMRFEDRGLSADLKTVQRFFPCRACGGRDALLLPCTAAPRPKATAAGLIAAYFHGMRSQAKKTGRRG